MRKLVVGRRASQLFFLGFFIYILWSTTYPLKGLISPQVLFKIDPLLMVMTAVSERALLPGLIFSLAMIGLTLVLGRFFCGWMCPMGTVIDGVGFFRRGIRKPLTEHRRTQISQPKFLILTVVALLALVGTQAAWVVDPIVTSARVVSLNIIPTVTLAVDQAFQIFIQKFGLYGDVYDFYRSLKAGFLGVNIHFFSNSLLTFVFFLLATGAGCLVTRLWCRMLCPLGAFYALNSRSALLERKVTGCTSCGVCAERCRTGAIQNDANYRKGECILCMDCVYDCEVGATEFKFRGLGAARQNFVLARSRLSAQLKRRRVRGSQAKKTDTVPKDKGIDRRNFLFLLSTGLCSLGFKRVPTLHPRPPDVHPVIRPPGALPEGQFINTCVRCGNCMKVCITNGLQPVILESGWDGIWTPQLVPEIGYCEYNCTLCGEVCPTGAIPRLSLAKKQKAKMGIAEIDRNICIVYKDNKECIVCEEHCPVSEKAIKAQEEVPPGNKIFKPIVDEDLCIGCGICQTKCPTSPRRAIRINPSSPKLLSVSGIQKF